MRDLIFRNLTSENRRRKAISSMESLDKDGVHSKIQRHFACIVREVKEKNPEKPLPYLHVVKEHNSLKQTEGFYCKIKGSVFAVHEGRLFLILFIHTLKIQLTPVAQEI